MRVMAFDTFAPSFVPFIFNAQQPGPATVRIIEKSVAPETEFSAAIDGKEFDIIRVIDGRSMAIFALHSSMR